MGFNTLVSFGVLMNTLFLMDVYVHIEGVDLHSAMAGSMRRRRSSSQHSKYYAGGRVTPGEMTVVNFRCRINSTIVVSEVIWGVHKDSRSAATYYLPGDCIARDASLKSDCSKSSCTIKTTAPVELPCQSSWRGSKVPQYIHTNFFCMTDGLKTLDICERRGYETSAGYITTPGHGFSDNISDCSCILTPTTGRGSDTTIRVLDFQFQIDATANEMCSAMMQIGDDTYCRNESITYSPISQEISVRRIHDSPIQLGVQIFGNNHVRFVFHFDSNTTLHWVCGTNLSFPPKPLTSESSVLISTVQTNTQEIRVETTAPTSRIPSTFSRISTETETHEASSMGGFSSNDRGYTSTSSTTSRTATINFTDREEFCHRVCKECDSHTGNIVYGAIVGIFVGVLVANSVYFLLQKFEPRCKCNKKSKEDTTLESSYITAIGPRSNDVTHRNSHDVHQITSYENVDMSVVYHTPPYTNIKSDIEGGDERVNVTHANADYVDVSNPDTSRQRVTTENENEYAHLDGARAPENMYDRLRQNGTNI